MFEKFLASCQTYQQWFRNLSLDDARLRELYESGYIFPLKDRDPNGCRIIMIQAKNLDTKKFNFSDIVRIINLVIFTLLEEPETQITGFVYIFDHKDITMDYISLFSLIDIRNYLKCVQNAMPGRQKRAIWVNLPSFAVKLTDLCKPLVSAKLRERACFYKDMNNVYGHIDPKTLPKEYGGQTPLKEMMEIFRILAETHKAKLVRIDQQCIDLDKIKSLDLEMGNSFKKLEIDQETERQSDYYSNELYVVQRAVDVKMERI